MTLKIKFECGNRWEGVNTFYTFYFIFRRARYIFWKFDTHSSSTFLLEIVHY